MSSFEIWRSKSRVGLASFYGIAGILHIALPAPFLLITPAWVPDAPTVIQLTGVCEIAGAIGLLIPKVRPLAGLMLALYAVCVYPANIKHAVDTLNASGATVWQYAYHIVRLPLQPVLVWLALFCGEIVEWPFGRPGMNG